MLFFQTSTAAINITIKVNHSRRPEKA